MKKIELILIITTMIFVGTMHVHAETESDGISAGAISSATGDVTHASVGVLAAEVNGNSIAIAQSMADAKGKEISLLSEAHATGKIVYGEGKVKVTGETTKSSVEAFAEKVKEGLYSITVIVRGYGSSSNGDASGETYALAWAADPQEPVQPKPVIQPFFGYLFGKSDAERYYTFKHQIDRHNRLAMANNGTNDTAVYKHAVYWRDVILNDYGLNESQFEYKYTLQEVIRLNPDLVKRPVNNSK